MSNHQQTILIVEDEEFLRQTMAEQLRQKGFQVIEAQDGKKGLSIIVNDQPNLVLLDLMLPKMPGEQVLKEMNENGLIKKIPVIVTSVKADEANARNCLEMWGATAYLVKSDFSLEEIVNKVSQILKKNKKNHRR